VLVRVLVPRLVCPLMTQYGDCLVALATFAPLRIDRPLPAPMSRCRAFRLKGCDRRKTPGSRQIVVPSDADATTLWRSSSGLALVPSQATLAASSEGVGLGDAVGEGDPDGDGVGPGDCEVLAPADGEGLASADGEGLGGGAEPTVSWMIATRRSR